MEAAEREAEAAGRPGRPAGDADAALAALFPEAVVTVRARDAHWEAPLHPEEERAVARAVEARRRHFSAGRACAREALARLGIADAVLPPLPDRRPAWPPGVVATISHCEGFCAAAAASAHALGAVGFDAERRRRVDGRLAERICTRAELAAHTALGGDPREWATLAFAAKEAGYKCLNPVSGLFVDFKEAEIDVAPERAELCIRMVAGPLAGIEFGGRYAFLDDVVLAAATLSRAEAAIVAARAGRAGPE